MMKKWHVSPEFNVASVAKDFTSLSEAKRYGALLAKKRAWGGRGFNVMWSSVSIYLKPSPGYLVPYMSMAFPVRGTGKSAKQILSAMERYGEPALKWVKNKNYKRAVARFFGKPYEHL